MRNIPHEELEKFSTILKAISHPVRLNILEALEENKEMNVQELASFLNEEIEQSLLSHHLIKMKDKGVLDCRREGKYIFYSLKLSQVLKVLDCMENCFKSK